MWYDLPDVCDEVNGNSVLCCSGPGSAVPHETRQKHCANLDQKWCTWDVLCWTSVWYMQCCIGNVYYMPRLLGTYLDHTEKEVYSTDFFFFFKDET